MPTTRPNPPRRPASTPAEGVLEQDGATRLDAEAAGGFQKQGRVGLARQAQALQVHPVDPNVDQVIELRSAQNGGAVLAR